ncbi:MAG: hypothetical protein RMH75_07285 [Archaeoglobaceae archaeon]|nr:hypothetical protein [Archaeoglobaceae archaeon]
MDDFIGESVRVFVDYVQSIDGKLEKRVIRVGDGSIIQLFNKTTPPRKDCDVVCPHFLELKWANGCYFSCAWCYLQGTFRFLERGTKPFIKDWKKIESHLRALFNYNSRKELLNAGELSDSLIGEHLNPPASIRLAKMFQEQNRYELLLVTKSDQVDNLLKIEPKNVIVSFSINAFSVAERWETAPHPMRRIEAGKRLYDHGYRVRVRIDPIVPVPEWKKHYEGLIEKVFNSFEPKRITLGTLRGLSTTIRNAKDKTWTEFLEERSNWGLKSKFETRLEIYKYLIDLLNEIGFKEIGLCKETLKIWKDLGLDYRKIKCNCIL